MKNCYVVYARHYDFPVIAVCTNLKEVHKIVNIHMEQHESPEVPYSKFVADFKERKEYYKLNKEYECGHSQDYHSIGVDWVGEMNMTI
jgi:hypothetical protein